MAPPTSTLPPITNPTNMNYRAALPEGFRTMLRSDIPVHKEIRLMFGIVASGLTLAVATMYWTIRKPEVQFRRGGAESTHHHPLEFEQAEKLSGKQYVLKYGKGEAAEYKKVDAHLQEVQKAMSEARRP